jgi:hypothetical protein
MKIHYQGIKSFCDSPAGKGALQADENGIDYYQNAGRPSGSGRIENNNSGGHRDEEIKIRFRGGEPLKHRGIPMKYNAVSTFKLYCIDETSKIMFQLCQGEVA